jgi:hypothetical protein
MYIGVSKAAVKYPKLWVSCDAACLTIMHKKEKE